eukprot:TRINITY_DN20916_c0_g1_i1.p1 TRINITY_DN20916_c0_g1~~TRINITY_DN20916_c0_g1_i1.p1  ORF type:complete len:431 (+),score=245.55 TRINITY_DN20916_c0_g1_i1:56-1348(+)
MALVEVGTGAQDIADIAAQTKELDAQIKDYNRELQQVEREIGDTNKEKGLLETALMLSELQINKLRVFDRLKAAKPDPEVAAKLQELRNRLKLEQKKNKLAEQAKKTTLSQYDKKLFRLEELNTQLEETKAKTNWAELSKKRHASRDFMGQENKLKEIKLTLKSLDDEQKVRKQLTSKKELLIDQLKKRLDELDEKAVEYEQVKAELKEQESEKLNAQDDLRTLNRIYHKKDGLIKKLQKDLDVNDPQSIKRLEADKKVLQYQITKHGNYRRANEMTITAQHRRLKTLEAKLEAIAMALKSLKKDDLSEEQIMQYRPGLADSTIQQVDATLYRDVQNELENATRSIEAKDVLMTQKDATVEVLEKKVEILTNASRVLMRKLKLDSNERELEKREMYGAIEREEEQHNENRERLMQEKQDLDRIIAGRKRG